MRLFSVSLIIFIVIASALSYSGSGGGGGWNGGPIYPGGYPGGPGGGPGNGGPGNGGPGNGGPGNGGPGNGGPGNGGNGNNTNPQCPGNTSGGCRCSCTCPAPGSGGNGGANGGGSGGGGNGGGQVCPTCPPTPAPGNNTGTMPNTTLSGNCIAQINLVSVLYQQPGPALGALLSTLLGQLVVPILSTILFGNNTVTGAVIPLANTLCYILGLLLLVLRSLGLLGLFGPGSLLQNLLGGLTGLTG